MNERIVTLEELERVLNTKFEPQIVSEIGQSNLVYQDLSLEEREEYINSTLNVLFEDLIAAGPKRIGQWESGWEQNLVEFQLTGNPDHLIPKYHSKYNYLRWNKRIIKPINKKFDYNIHCIIVDWVISKYLSNVNGIYEFGCGPAYHLLRARKLNRNALLVGLDWTTTSQIIISEIKTKKVESNIEGYNFDFCNPNYNVDIIPNSGIITVAALEQIGSNFKEFVNYLLTKKPEICVHLEPIDELMDRTNIIDNLSVLYCRKRNYLNGFLPYLEQLEKDGKVKILNKQRTFSGSQYIEGHSLIVWKPI